MRRSTTSLEVEVEVYSEEILTGVRQLTSRAYLTFVTIDRRRQRVPVPPLHPRDRRGEAASAKRRKRGAPSG